MGFLDAEFNWDTVLYPRRGARHRPPSWSPPSQPSPSSSSSPPLPSTAVWPLRGSARPPHAPRPPRRRALPTAAARLRAGARPWPSASGLRASRRSHWLPGAGAGDVSRGARSSHSCGSRRRARPRPLSHSPLPPPAPPAPDAARRRARDRGRPRRPRLLIGCRGTAPQARRDAGARPGGRSV